VPPVSAEVQEFFAELSEPIQETAGFRIVREQIILSLY